MLKKLSATCLLLLALSPCTAPFQIVTADDRALIPSIEFSVLRSAHNPRSIVGIRSSAWEQAAIRPQSTALSVVGRSRRTPLADWIVPANPHGAYPASGTLLRV
jgi:hypothetical protein